MVAWYQWPMMPVHALGVATGAKSFEKNPILGSPALNRQGLHILRREWARRMAERRRAQVGQALSPEDRASLLRDGFVVKENFLPDASFAAMREEIFSQRIEAREYVDGYSLTRLIPLDAQTLGKLPATAAALAFPPYQALHDYANSFRQKPFQFVQTIFSNFRAAEPDIQSDFHIDTFHPTVKSWLFLEDVAEGEAGFTYVPGSHRPTRRHLAWERRVSISAATSPDRSTREGSLRIEPDEIARLGYGPPVKFAAKANTLIVADTSGFHRRGVTDKQTRRIAIWSYARSTPFKPWPGGDVIGAMGLDKRAVRVFWAVQDGVKKARGRQGGWGWVGERCATDPPTP